MRRRLVVAIAVVMSVLTITAMPAAASHGPVVVSQHTTDTDFGDATLTNATINGTGSAATVEVQHPEVLNDSFGDLNGYTEVSVTGDASWSATNGFARAEVTTVGAEALVNDSLTVRDLELEVQNTTLFGGHGNEQPSVVLAWQDADNHVQVRLTGNNDELGIHQYVDGTSSKIASAAFTWQTDTAYNLVVEKDGQTVNATVYDQSGTQLVTTEGTVDSSLDQSGQVGLAAIGDAGAKMSWSDLVVRSGDPGFGESGEYLGPNHIAENTEQGFVDITELVEGTVCVTWETSDGGPFSTLTQTCGITTAANHSFTWPEEPNSTVRVNVTAEATGDDFSFVMDDEAVLADASAPVVDNSSASPTGTLNDATPTLSIDANDSDFGLAQSDQVEVSFFVDNESVGTDTLTANGTASVTLSEPLTGGEHTWHAVANDSYGHAPGATSETFTISTPGQITIRNVSEPYNIIKDAEAEVLIAGSGETVDEQTVTDGNISLSGIPSDETYVIIVDAPGYHVRSAVVTDIFEQSSIFLLNETNEPSVETTFEIEDPVGSLDEPLLLIQKSINRSRYDSDAPEEYQWTTVAGSRLSATGSLTIVLEQDALYRLEIHDGSSVIVLGEHPASNAGTYTLIPAEPVLDATDPATDVGYRIDRNADSIFIDYSDPTVNTSELTVIIHERGNESNQLQPNETYTDLGELVLEEPLTGDERNTSWVVKLNYTRNGNVYVIRETLGGPSGPEPPPELDPMWKQIGAVLVLVLFGGAFSVRTAGAGAFAVSGMGGILWHIGWLSPPAGFAAVSISMGIGVIALLGRGR